MSCSWRPSEALTMAEPSGQTPSRLSTLSEFTEAALRWMKHSLQAWGVHLWCSLDVYPQTHKVWTILRVTDCDLQGIHIFFVHSDLTVELALSVSQSKIKSNKSETLIHLQINCKLIKSKTKWHNERFTFQTQCIHWKNKYNCIFTEFNLFTLNTPTIKVHNFKVKYKALTDPLCNK